MEIGTIFSRPRRKLKHIKQYSIKQYYRWRVLKNLKLEHTPCLLCGNERDFETLYEKDRYGFAIPVVRCTHCSFVFERPAPTQEFLDTFYASRMYRGLYRGVLGASERHLKENKSVRHAPRNAEFIALQNPPENARILDFGSSEGTFLKACKERLPRSFIYGIEPGSNFSSFYAKEFDGMYPSIEAVPPSLRFDYITLWHVLEHMKNPIATLTSLSHLLAPGGKIIIEVPNVDKYVGIKSIHIGHLYHWSPKTIEMLAKKAGLRVEKITDEYTNVGAFGMKVILAQ